MTPTADNPGTKSDAGARQPGTAGETRACVKEALKPGATPTSTAKDDLKSIPMGDLQAKLQSSPKGLTQAEAAKRLTDDGPNALKVEKTNAFLKFLTYFLGTYPLDD